MSVSSDIRLVVWTIDPSESEDQLETIRLMKQRGIPSVCVVSNAHPIDDLLLETSASFKGVGEVLSHYGLSKYDVLVVKGGGTGVSDVDGMVNVVEAGEIEWLKDSKHLNDCKTNNVRKIRGSIMDVKKMNEYQEKVAKEDTFEEALAMLRTASKKGDAWASGELIEQLLKKGGQKNLEEAFRMCNSRKSEGGHMNLYLARMYRDGLGTKANVDKSLEYYRLAEQDNIPAAHNELIDLLRKRGTENDLAEAFNIAVKYSNRGDARSKYHLAQMYHKGSGTSKDIDRAVDLMRAASNSKVGGSRNMLVDYLVERDAEGDAEEAFATATLASKEGDLWAQARLARIYRSGKGTEKDLDKAVDLMTSAMNGGVSFAKSELVDTLVDRAKGDDIERAIELSKQLGSKYYGVMGRLARMYRDGKGVDKNLDTSISMMRIAHEGGIGWAKNELIDVLVERGTSADLAEAFKLASEPTDNKYTIARLARLYRDGKGVKKDTAKAMELSRSVYDSVNFAREDLIQMLIEAGTEESKAEAFKLETKLSLSGDKYSQGRLARMYRDGVGTERDVDLAISLMRASADKGVPWAKAELKDMLQKRDGNPSNQKAEKSSRRKRR